VTALARVAAVVAGIACLVLAGAMLVRQASLAADGTLRWPESGWWTALTEEPSWTTTGVAAAVLAAAAVFLIVLAVRQLGGDRRTSETIAFSADDTKARVSVAGLERGMASRFQSVVPGSRAGSVSLRRESSGWRARFEAAVPPDDVAGVRERAFVTLRDDLRRLGGVELVRLDLIVTSLRRAAGKRA